MTRKQILVAIQSNKESIVRYNKEIRESEASRDVRCAYISALFVLEARKKELEAMLDVPSAPEV